MTETDRRGTPKVRQLDALGRAVTMARGGILLEKNTYDEAGNKVVGEDGEGRRARFVFDHANRLIQRADGDGTADAAATAYVYDAAGNKRQDIELDHRL